MKRYPDMLLFPVKGRGELLPSCKRRDDATERSFRPAAVTAWPRCGCRKTSTRKSAGKRRRSIVAPPSGSRPQPRRHEPPCSLRRLRS